MPHPELKDNDVFHVIGFTRQDVLAGRHMSLMNLMTGSRPSSEGKIVEVYFLDAVTAPAPDAFVLYGDYLGVYFYSDTALALSEDYGLALPPVIATLTRVKLPVGIGTSIRMPFPAARGKSASG
jgi:hypothetical protein